MNWTLKSLARMARATCATRTTRVTRLAGTALLACGLVAGCATPLPPLPDDPAFARVADPDARRELQLGQPLAAADVYTGLAARASDAAERQDYLLTAAEILYDRAMVGPGAARLAAVPSNLSTPELAQRRAILVAKALLLDADPEGALAALPSPEAVAGPLHRARVYETRAQAWHALGNPDEELVARVALENELSDPAIIERGQAQIWLMLGELPISTLQRLTTNVRGDVYQGWVELALALADSGRAVAVPGTVPLPPGPGDSRPAGPGGSRPGEPVDGDAGRREAILVQWRTLFPDHPANGRFLDSLAGDTRFAGFSIDGSSIENVAVLLPLSDPVTSAAAASIRDGIIAAHARAARTARVPGLRFYDVGANAGYARSAYESALRDGADAVIGPLRKEAVAAIVTRRRVPVPTLLLNTVDAGTASASSDAGERENAIQFGLAPEDEAYAAASRAMALSLVDAVVLQSDDSRGDREARAFQQAMYDLGGDVVHVGVLPAGEYDYSDQIRAALAIDDSDDRFRTLSRTIGERLFFEPAIRNDVDVVFLALTNEQARSVRPQLDFFRASRVPRFATSRIAALDDDRKKSRDLNTIWFADAPWVLDPALDDDPLKREIIASFPDAAGVYGKLYALGADAWTLINELDALADGRRIEGFTGELSLARDGHVRRRLDWAQYRDGIAVPVERLEAPEDAAQIRPES